jgi:Tol biopolymer transport system component
MKKHLLITICLILNFCVCVAQRPDSKFNEDEQKFFESANGLFEEKLYDLAYERYKNLLDAHTDDTYLKYLVGICGIYVSDKHDEALILLSEVREKNKKAADLDYYFALLYHKTYQFDKSIELANKLLENSKIKPEQRTALKQLLENCKNGQALVALPVNAKIQTLGTPPNTEAAEYSPVITSDEETMLYTYRGKESMGGLRDLHDLPNPFGYYYEDIFITRKADGKWSKGESIGENNTESNDAVVAISNDGQQLFIFRANETDGGDLYMSTLDGTRFTTAEKLKGDINTTSWEGSISLSGDQKRVIFASERPGGNGGKDLYSAVKLEDGSWGHVKNLGNNINTSFDEDAPFIHPDGRTLVFSSKGHNSMGEFDIFTSDLDELDSSWKKPVNVGYPINTTDDDIYYVLSADGKRGYFASAKKGGQGDKDIYMVEPAIGSKKSYLTIIKGKLTENLLPYKGEVIVQISANGGRNYGTFRSNSASGNYLLSLPSGYNYKLSFYHSQYGEKTADVITEKVDGFAEKVVNINFGEKDTTAKHQTITFPSNIDPSAVVTTETKTAVPVTPKPAETKPTEPVATEKPAETKPVAVKEPKPVKEKPVKEKPVKETKPVEAPVTASSKRAEMLEKYGTVTIANLKYLVQVGAYRHPENYKSDKIKSLCSTKQSGVIMTDVNLIIADKEFDTWKEADTFLNQVRGAGQKDAFLTANYNGKRYYLKDLAELGVWSSAQ